MRTHRDHDPGHDLAELERAGWQALSSDGERAREFYDEVLDRRPVMLLPGGLALDDREQILRSLSGPPWDAHDLSELRVRMPATDVGVVTYRAVARRGDSPPYTALMSSVYARRAGRWRLTMHQQTPV